jgi:hypothetical protein
MLKEVAAIGGPDQPGFYPAEIELRLEVMAGGELKIFGSGAEANATGGIRVLYKRGQEKSGK